MVFHSNMQTAKYYGAQNNGAYIKHNAFNSALAIIDSEQQIIISLDVYLV